jgi:CspA family cold shock protein
MGPNQGAVRLDTGELLPYPLKVVDSRDLNALAVLDEVFVKLVANENGGHDVVQLVRKSQPGKGQWAIGRVKWFQDSTGFGFILPQDNLSKVEVFFHFTSLNPGGFRSINDGAEVIYHVVKGPRGLVATRVYTI